MRSSLRVLASAMLLLPCLTAKSQTLPGDSLVFGPVMSPVYHDTVKVWVVTKSGTGSGNTYSMELSSNSAPGTLLTGSRLDSVVRLQYYNLRSYKYWGLTPGQTYTAAVKKNGSTVVRTASVKDAQATLSDFEFLAGGCGRIYDLSRCVDAAEAPAHVNGTPAIYNQMAKEGSDMMVWLGDAVYLLGIEHAGGMCPGLANDWDTQDSLFKRYIFYRKLHDSLVVNMPQLAITDNHDMGGNEYNKTMPTLGIAKANFMQWWVNPEYRSNPDGQGLYSSYRYKDVEFFLLDNRSYRESTTRHLGVYQLAWLKQALLNSTAPFKVLISGTPAFDKHWGGRNFSITAECDTLLQFIKANNIDGVLCYSADIHNQEFYGKYNDHTYPFFDILSGNLASDIGNSSTISPASDMLFFSNMQTYTRTNVYGILGDRRYNIEYISPNGVKYYGAIIHEDMLKSIDDSTRKFVFNYANTLYDSSKYHRVANTSGISYTQDRNGNAASALAFGNSSVFTVPYTAELNMSDRTFSFTGWIKPSKIPASGYSAIYSNSNGSNGCTIGLDANGHLVYINHGSGTTYVSNVTVDTGNWMHITWKYDNVKLQLFLCLNGQLVQQWNNVATPVATTADIHLGGSYTGHHFEGAIDEVVLYGKLITDKTLQKISGYTPARGAAISLTTSSDMTIPNADATNILKNPFTVEFWGRITATPVTGGKLLSNNGRVNNNTAGMTIEFSAAKKLNVSFGNNTSGWTAFTDAGNVWQVGEWNHVALTAVPNDSIYLYVNGIKAATVRYGTYTPGTWALALGKSINYGQPVQCNMDEFRLWKAAQPIDSIRKRMHQDLTGIADTNLVYYYNFSPFTDTTIKSAGTNAYEMKLKAATLTSSTAPVAQFLPAQRATVKGNWSVRKDQNMGLKLDNAIPGFDNNFVTGKNTDTTIAVLNANNNSWYLKGGWQFNALNIPVATLSVDLSQCLAGYDSIGRLASEYYLLKENGNTLEKISNGYYNGQMVRFMNCFLDTGIYHIGWNADTASRILKRGGALSMLGAHDVQVPYAKVNNVLHGGATVEFWTRLMQQPAAGAALLGNRGRVNNLSAGFSLEMTGGNGINAVFGDSSANWVTLQSATPLNINEWNHVALTITPNGQTKLYLNGELKDSTTAAKYVSSQLNLALGKSFYFGGESIGLMDELRIWNKVKTADEINNQMHVSMPSNTPGLICNYTFNHLDNGYIVNKVALKDSVAMTNARIIPSTSPVGDIDASQRYHVTGNWSIRDSVNSGLSIMVSIPDYDANLVVGKDSLTGSSVSPSATDKENLNTLWQIDPLKLSVGEFSFDGHTILGNDWAAVKAKALEFYLLKKDASGQLVVEAIGTLNNDTIDFNTINLGYGYYTLGWKSVTTGIVEVNGRTIKVFPNPSNDYVMLSGISATEVAQVNVLTATGQSVPASTEAVGNDLRMNVSNLVPGMYIINVRMKRDNQMASMKFIKQ